MADDGKSAFDDVYNRLDARAYYRTLGRLGYEIPQHGADLVDQIIGSCFADRAPTVLDICCSYGVAGMLLTTDLSLDDVYAHYAEMASDTDPDVVLRADQQLLGRHRRLDPPTVLGLDIAERAVGYAVQSTALDDAFAENLEADDPSPGLVARLRDVDLIITTGGIGYVTELTFDRLLGASEGTPWVAAFCLRAYDYSPITQLLAGYGLVTETSDRHYIQRRFSDAEEQEWGIEQVLANGHQPASLEADGHYYADFFLSRAAESVAERPLHTLLTG